MTDRYDGPRRWEWPATPENVWLNQVLENVDEARRKSGKTQGQVAKELRLSAPAISHWVTGARDISVRQLYRIATACGWQIHITLVRPGERLDSVPAHRAR